MLTTETKNKYTEKDYMLLEEGAPFQLINYDLIMSPSPTSKHQLISMKLTGFILDFLRNTNNKGLFLSAPMDVKLDDGNIFQPDLIYVTAERKEKLLKDRIEGAPDLIIEILSPANGYYDLRQKKDMYEKYGVAEYIIIDPLQLSVEIYVLKEALYVLDQKVKQPETFHSTVLNGFSVELKELFAQ
ncbi:Uma2 family endonuclease [Mucilaginibacter sp.]|uniref:Uma2 family endonuclease n=1 Tax=Mucilaginibacter sp. TaxID=1882438 RepID=UPI003B00793A